MRWGRWCLHKLFGWTYIVLEDYDGSLHVRRLKFAGEWGAWRMGLGVRWVTVLDGGGTNGCCYVKFWYPYEFRRLRRHLPPQPRLETQLRTPERTNG